MRSVLTAVWPRVRPSLAVLVVITLVVAVVGAPSVSATNTRSNGYWIALAHGEVNGYGDAPPLGGQDVGNVVDMATTPTGHGYWLALSSGEMVSIGDAQVFATPSRGGPPIVAIGARPQGDGVWLLSSGGELLAFGASSAFAPLDGRSPFSDIAVTPTGAGIWALDKAGDVHVRGDAVAYGNAPGSGVAVAIAPTPSGNGYWVLASTGAVTALGAAPDLGSATSGVYVDMAVTRSGLGYWLLDNLGRVTAFGDAVHYGDIGGPGFKHEPPVAIAVTPFVNLPPIAVDDIATLDEDTSAIVSVLANDNDPENDPLRVKIKFPPLHGTATVLPDQTIRYVPAPDFNGADSFTYEIDDGLGGLATSVVRLTIRPVNDMPVATDDAYVTDEDVALVVAAPGVLANDTDVDGDALAAAVVTGPTHGTLVLGADGSVSYTPSSNFNGLDSFRYRATDPSGTTSEATVHIIVRAIPDAPIAAEDTYGTDEETALVVAAPGVLANDSDADGDALAAILRDGPLGGTLTLNLDGSFAYTPSPDFNGEDIFSYVASDGALTSGITFVHINVAPVNDEPTALADVYDAAEDLRLDVVAPGVLGNDDDVDGDPLSSVLVTGPTRGTLTLNASGAFSYSPNANQSGPDSFTYRAVDPSGASSAITTVAITVAAVPDAPIAANDSYTVANTAVLNVAAPGVLANDTDADGDTLSAALVSGPAVGTLTLNADGSFSYDPPSGHVGSVTFTYRALDGTLVDDATVTISVTGSTGGGGGGCCLPFSLPVPEIFDFESFNGVPAIPGTIGRTTLGGAQVEILGPWWLE